MENDCKPINTCLECGDKLNTQGVLGYHFHCAMVAFRREGQALGTCVELVNLEGRRVSLKKIRDMPYEEFLALAAELEVVVG